MLPRRFAHLARDERRAQWRARDSRAKCAWRARGARVARAWRAHARESCASARVTRNARETRASRTRVAPWRLLPSFARRSSAIWEKKTQKRLTERSGKKKSFLYKPGVSFSSENSQGQSLTSLLRVFALEKFVFHKQRACFPSEKSQGHTCRCKEARPPPLWTNYFFPQEVSTPGVEPGLSRPQRDVLTTRRCRPCWCKTCATLPQQTRISLLSWALRLAMGAHLSASVVM